MEHMICKTWLIGLLLVLHLAYTLTYWITSSSIVIGLDNQATIRSPNNQRSKPAYFLLDQIHTTAEWLYTKQDCIQQKLTFQWTKQLNYLFQAKTRGVCDLQIHWVPGHCNFKPNKRADKAAKRAVLSESNPTDFPPQTDTTCWKIWVVAAQTAICSQKDQPNESMQQWIE